MTSRRRSGRSDRAYAPSAWSRDGVSETRFGHLSRHRGFPAPVPERTTEPVHGRVRSSAVGAARATLRAQLAAAGRRRPEDRIAAQSLPRLLEDFERPARQRDPMLPPGLRPGPGTVQTATSSSISSRQAPRTSPDRAAVSTRNSSESRTPAAEDDSRTVASAFATSPCGRALKCWDSLPFLGSAAVSMATEKVPLVATENVPLHMRLG